MSIQYFVFIETERKSWMTNTFFGTEIKKKLVKIIDVNGLYWRALMFDVIITKSIHSYKCIQINEEKTEQHASYTPHRI